ncbi:hypothetical protein IIA79_04795, partial [bacterium]|nr:hypothetical protein [bacterium]
GHAKYRNLQHPQNRFLSITGAILDFDYTRVTFGPSLEKIKARFFSSHPDDPVVLHRNELIGARPPFQALKDPQVRAEFDIAILSLLASSEYWLLTATVDKAAMIGRYAVWQTDPYHYALMVILERYVLWLGQRGGYGDVMAESRGGSDDHRLKNAYKYIYSHGTAFLKAGAFHRNLTSNELKVKQKIRNIPGLQLVDLLASPCFEEHKSHILGTPSANVGFRAEIAAVAVPGKYHHGPNGQIEGYGRKWLP